jgi:DNA end-binding protein Ku
MARQLIDSLTSDFDPERYHDEYREAVLDLIERKSEGQEIVMQPAEEPERVPDLMAALEASLAAAKKDGDGDNGSSGKKKAPAKRGGAKSKPKAKAKS